MLIDTITYGDNYIYLLTVGSRSAVIDPSDADVVLNTLKSKGTDLTQILVTHNHMDHTAGCRKLRKLTGIEAEKPKSDSISVLDKTVKVIPTPGHTTGSVCYYFPEKETVFTGDTLFIAGCGRVFTGDYAGMWQSLLKLRALPPETQVYCGHNYTRDNLKFALTVEPANHDAAAALEETGRSGAITVPSSISRENKINPFLRADNETLKSVLNMTEAPALEVFTLLRKQKDAW
ncbi:MAG: hydroxyacylglutathione hydrolase [Verrucomicrobiota bacterium]